MSERVAEQESLGRSAARGGAVTLLAQLVRIAVQAISLAVLARVLHPADFGYVAMVAAMVGIGDVIKEFGLAKAAVQDQHLTDGQRDNLFWLNTALGAVVAAAAFVAAPAVAGFYGEPALVDITRWFSLTFLLNGIAAQYRASLLREMRFGATAAFEVVGSLLGLAVAIGVAVADGGYWALIAQQLTAVSVATLSVVVVARWLPGLPRRAHSVRRHVAYGSHLLGAQMLAYLGANVDTIVVGARLGVAAAGLYDRVFQLMTLPVRQLTWPVARVALPVLARLVGDSERYERFLRRGQLVLAHAIVPVLTLCVAVAGPVIDVVLGPQWTQASTTFAILAVGGVFQSVSFVPGWIFMSSARTDVQLRLAMISHPVAIGAVLVGSLWGMNGIAAGYSLAYAVLWPVGLWWAGRTLRMRVGGLFLDALRALVAYGGAALAAGLVVHRLGPSSPWAAIGVGLGAMLGVLAIVTAVWPAYRRDLADIASSRGLLRRATAPRDGEGPRRADVPDVVVGGAAR